MFKQQWRMWNVDALMHIYPLEVEERFNCLSYAATTNATKAVYEYVKFDKLFLIAYYDRWSYLMEQLQIMVIRKPTIVYAFNMWTFINTVNCAETTDDEETEYWKLTNL